MTKDRVLQDFVNSPGAQAIREQYAKMGYPAWTGKLSYGTKQAFNETIVQKFFDVMAPPGSALAVDGETSNSSTAQLFDRDHWGNVGLQVGGFGNPPKDQSWAQATAHRCDADRRTDLKGNHVEFQVVNVAGRHSFSYHELPDRPLSYNGPMRSIVQVFRWQEKLFLDH